MWLRLNGLLVLVLEQKVFGLENLSGGEIFREVFFSAPPPWLTVLGRNPDYI